MCGFPFSGSKWGHMHKGYLICFAVLCGLFLLHAAPRPALADETATPQYIQTHGQCPESAYKSGLTVKVVTCIKDVVKHVFNTTYSKLYNYLKPTISTVFLASLIAYGVLLMLGAVPAPRLTAQTAAFALKLAAIAYFITHLDVWFIRIIEAQEDLMHLVTKAATSNKLLVCKESAVKDVNLMWMRIDCLPSCLVFCGAPPALSSTL